MVFLPSLPWPGPEGEKTHNNAHTQTIRGLHNDNNREPQAVPYLDALCGHGNLVVMILQTSICTCSNITLTYGLWTVDITTNHMKVPEQ